MQWTDATRIETPEQIDVSLELAGLGSRFVARVIDWLIKALLLLVLGAFVAVSLVILSSFMTLNPKFLAMGIAPFAYLLLLSYDVYFEAWRNGQTPGKHRAAVRVIREGGGPVDFRTACVRSLLALADFLPVFYLLGGLLVMATRRHQRLGDLAAGTIVVRERSEFLPGEVDATVQQLASPAYVFTSTHLSACTPEDRHLLRSFLERYHDLDISHRHALACRLAEQYIRRLSHPAAPCAADGVLAEQFLASLFRDLESAARAG